MNLHSTRQRPWFRLFVAFVVLGVGLLVTYDTLSSNPVNPFSASLDKPVTVLPVQAPDVTPFPTLEPFEATVAAVMRTIPTGTPDYNMPDGKGPDKQRSDVYYKAWFTVVAEHPITPQPTWTPVPHLTPLEPTPQVAGAGVILDERCWGSKEFKQIGSENQWQEVVGTNDLVVCAGTLSVDPPQAGVLIVVSDPYVRKFIAGPDIYPLAAQARSLRVIDAVGERLTLRSDLGALFYFDVPTRQWVTP